MYTCFDVTQDGHVAHVQLNRPEALNTMNEIFWRELPAIFASFDADPQVRAVVISSTGRHFTAGLDLNWAGTGLSLQHADAARAREQLRRQIRELQEAFTTVDRCRVPVIAAIQGGCIGGGVDFITACDIRMGSADCFFTIQEVNLAIVADVGTLQRIPYLLPQGLVRELAYTGRRWMADEALTQGFINRLLPDHQQTVAAALEMAAEIAGRSPLAISGIKQVLNAGRDMTIAQGLDYVATWNAAMLQGDDLHRAMKAQLAKDGPPSFDNLAG